MSESPARRKTTGSRSKATRSRTRSGKSSVTPASQKIETHHLNLCKGKIDIITMEDIDNFGDLLYIVIDDGKKQVLDCAYKSSFFGMINSSPKFAYWVRNPSVRKNQVDDSGHGMKPLPPVYGVIKRASTSVGRLFIDMGVYKGAPVKKRVPPTIYLKRRPTRYRIGNAKGTFGVGQLHGQAPGEYVYKIENVSRKRLLKWQREGLPGGKIKTAWDKFIVKRYYRPNITGRSAKKSTAKSTAKSTKQSTQRR
jgi:hypothetical protein